MSTKSRIARTVAALMVGSGALVTVACARDETSRFYGTWQAEFSANGQRMTLVSMHDPKGWNNYVRTSAGTATPAGSGGFSAANGKYSITVNGLPIDTGVYRFADDNTVICTSGVNGQTVTWTRGITAPGGTVSASAAVTAAQPAAGAPANTAAAPVAYVPDPALPPQTNAAIAAFNRKDYASAWQNFLAAAQAGDSEAQAGVGAMLFKRLNPPGTGYYAQCEQWLLASANRGNAKGMDFLAQYYYQSATLTAGGINPGVNNAPLPPALQQQAAGRYALARQWFERSAAKGDLYAMGNLAIMLDSGLGGVRDPGRAAQLRAQVKAGPDAGFSQKVNADPGKQAMTADWQSGHYADAVKVASDLANQGDAAAAALLARAYYEGQGVARDDHLAFNWAQRAATANDPDGLYYLGRCYENSRGVARNLTKAANLYDRAIELGNLEARSARGGIAWMTGEGRPAAGGPVFCNRSVSDGSGGCINDRGQFADPTSGKSLAGDD